MRRSFTITAALVALGVVLPSVASAADPYPPPSNPNIPTTAPKGPFKTYKVCPKLTSKAKASGCAFTSVQKAVDQAGPGDTVKVADGTYGEGVIVQGTKKRFLKLIGNKKNPQKVMFDAKKIPKGAKNRTEQMQNAVKVWNTNGVTVQGFGGRNYLANGFFMLNANGYTFKNLWAQNVGTYGIYVFNSIGGRISDSEASYNNDAGFYIGQTPPQQKPVQTQVSGVKSWGNVLGWSGTNMKYVTITKSDFYNNGTGIVPNALSSEKFAPPEHNVITNNRVFLNNFNYYKGTIPFKLKTQSTDGVPYPMGVGILLFGSQDTDITNNQVFGNYMVGIGELQQVLLAADTSNKAITPEWYTLRANRVTGNVLGNGGANPNGRSLFYDGSGTDNCWSGNDIGSEPTVPADGSTFVPCPFTGANTFDAAAQSEALGWALAINPKSPDSAESGWVKLPQAPVKGVTPLEHGTL